LNVEKIDMNKLLSIFFTTLICFQSADFSVNMKMTNTDKNHIELRVQVKNISNKPFRICEERAVDYKYEKIKSIGNYVIEVERKEADGYHLFPPTADIDPPPPPPRNVSFGKNEIIRDTIPVLIDFPQGIYRVRVQFYIYAFGPGHINGTPSDWVDFKME
jgi:hypothetical protein